MVSTVDLCCFTTVGLNMNSKVIKSYGEVCRPSSSEEACCVLGKTKQKAREDDDFKRKRRKGILIVFFLTLAMSCLSFIDF